MPTDFAIAKLIEAMGMFIHDLHELKTGSDCVYTEQSYNHLATQVLTGRTDIT